MKRKQKHAKKTNLRAKKASSRAKKLNQYAVFLATLLFFASLSTAAVTVSLVNENNASMNLSYDSTLTSYTDLGDTNDNAFVKICGASASQYVGLAYYSAGSFKTISFNIGGPLGELVPISSVGDDGCASVDVDFASYTAYYPGLPYVVVSNDNTASSDDSFTQISTDYSSGFLRGGFTYTNSSNSTHYLVTVTAAYTSDGVVISTDDDFIVVGLMKEDGTGISSTVTNLSEEVALATGGYAGNITIQINGIPPIALAQVGSSGATTNTPQLLIAVEGECIYQTTTITVTYSDFQSPATGAYVTVTLNGDQIAGAQADASGQVKFIAETEGVYEVRASATGYQSAYSQVSLLLCAQLCESDSDCATGVCLENGECAECATNGQCASGLCSNNACVACIADEECSTGNCVSGSCVSCSYDYECSSGSCENGRCGVCASSADCPTGLCLNGVCSSCASNSQCSTGLCQGGACTPCTSSSDCPSGLCVDNACVACSSNAQCSTGLCQGGVCSSCDANSDCQSNVCDGGACTQCEQDSDCGNGLCVAGVCVECLIDEQCESNLCSDGLCAACTRNRDCLTRICNEGACAICKEAGEPCSLNANCCSFECTEGTCIASECESDFECVTNYCNSGSCMSCLTNEDCAPGSCLNGACIECTSSGDCPTNLCLGGLCASCARNSDCPTGICVDGACQSCLVSGTECLSNENCCSNSCVAGACATCAQDSDCPFGYCDSDTGSCRCRAGDALCTGVLGVQASERPNVVEGRESRETRALGETGRPVAFALPQVPSTSGLSGGVIAGPRACEVKPFCTNNEDCCGGACIAGSCTCRMHGCRSTEECCSGYCYGGECVSAPKAILIAGVAAIQQPKSGCDGLIENCNFAGCFELCNGLWILLAILAIVAAYVSLKEEFKLIPVIMAVIPIALGVFTFPFAGIIIALLEIAFIASKK